MRHQRPRRPHTSIPPKVLEPVRRQRRVDGRAGDRPMPKPVLDRPGVVARGISPIVMIPVQHRAIQEVFLGRPYALPEGRP
jgi:hypothetical protein